MRIKSAILFFFVLPALHADPAQYVNPFIGTEGHGHTHPSAMLPFGMVQVGPDTRIEGWDAASGYHGDDRSIIGFSHLHLSGTGCADYNDILFLPTVGNKKLYPGSLKNPEHGYRSRFRKDRESASPGYYQVYLDDYQTKVELTATHRVAFHQYSFPPSQEAEVLIDLKHRHNENLQFSSVHIIDDQTIEGVRFSRGWANNQRVYFHAKFSKPFSKYRVYKQGKFIDQQKAEGKDIRIILSFPSDIAHTVQAKVSLSPVDLQGARKNIEAELDGWDFEKIKSEARQAWNQELGKIEIKGGTQSQRITFYSALYHTMMAPNLFIDSDGRYRGMDGKIHKKKRPHYTVFSLWDTFRALHPLFTIIKTKETSDFIDTFLTHYDQSGQLPIWELYGNETNTMIGYHAVPVIVDAFKKGIRGYDVEKAYQAVKASAFASGRGLEDYRRLGYVPADHESQSVSQTLEYAYDDWTISQMAVELGQKEDALLFANRGQNFRNLFDPETGFHRPRMASGGFKFPFDPLNASYNNGYTEGNAWQYTWYAPHAVRDLIEMMGGERSFVNKLDRLFSLEDESDHPLPPDVSGHIGQYAHGNEPSHHIAYLYRYTSDSYKSEYWVRKIMDTLYSDRPDGLSGNEDCGQMSAWYVFSAMGFYPVAPGENQYVLGSPLFDEVVIHLENGRQFRVSSEKNGPRQFYVDAIWLNTQPLTSPFLKHEEIMQGGHLHFAMSASPAGL